MILPCSAAATAQTVLTLSTATGWLAELDHCQPILDRHHICSSCQCGNIAHNSCQGGDTDAGAALVANLVHPGSVQVLIGCCHQRCPSAFLLLSSGQAKITVLELWHIDANQCSRLQIMSSLHEMTLMKPPLIAMNTISRLLHSFAATADRLATDQLLAADLCRNGKHCSEPSSVTAICISAGVAHTATSHNQKLHLSWPVDVEPGPKSEDCELEGAQGLSDETIYAFEADFRAEHKSEAGRCLVLQLPSPSGTRNILYHTFSIALPCQLVPSC